MDRTLEDTFYKMFTTRAFATGIPTTLAGTPVVSAYEDGSVTQITAGITLGVDHDGVTGLNLLTIVATAANGYGAGQDYNLVVTTGTVDSVSVVGEAVGEFSLSLDAAYKVVNHASYGNAQLVRSTTPANTLDVDANNRAEALLGAVTHTGAVIPTVSTLTGHTAQTGDTFGALPTNFSATVISGGGSVDTLVQGFLNVAITEGTAGRIADNFDTLFNNGDAISSLTLSSVNTVVPDAAGTAVTLADGAHGGSSAVLTFERIVGISTTTNEPAIALTGNGTGAGLKSTGGATGIGINAIGGATSGIGFRANAVSGNSHGMEASGSGTGNGLNAQGGATGDGMELNGGGTSGHGLECLSTGSNEIDANITGTLTTVSTLTGHTAQTGDNYARLGAPAGASVSADIAENQTDLNTLLSRITSTIFSGITSLGEWIGMLAGKQTGDATALAEIRATGAASGTFDPTTDSEEAIRDEGSANWTTGSGTGLTALASGTAQSGTASTIVLAAAAAFADNVLNGNVIKVTSGTGAGQSRVILSNTLADDTCNIAPNWATNPSSDSIYEIVNGSVNLEAVSLDNTAANNLESACDNYSATRGLSGTALPAAAADAAGGLPISDAGGLALDTQLAATNEVTAARMGALTDWINGGRLDLIIDAIKVEADKIALSDAGAGVAGSVIEEVENRSTPAQVNTEVVDVFKTDTISELAQGVPSATPTFENALMLLYMALRNKLDVTSGFKEVHNTAGTVICKKALSDDGTTYSEANMETGP